MVTKYGMSEKLGPITYGSDNNEVFLGRDMGHIRNYSEEIASEIDAEVRNIISVAYEKTEKILTDNMDRLHKVAEFLFHNEKMDGQQFEKIMKGEEEPELPEQSQPEELEKPSDINE